MAIYDNKGSEQNKNLVYSTEETKIGTWINGKPLYRKVFDNLSINTSTMGWKNVVTFSNVEDIVGIDYLIVDNTNRQRPNNPQVQISYLDNTIYTSATIDLPQGTTFTLKKIILMYTKTTD